VWWCGCGVVVVVCVGARKGKASGVVVVCVGARKGKGAVPVARLSFKEVLHRYMSYEYESQQYESMS